MLALQGNDLTLFSLHETTYHVNVRMSLALLLIKVLRDSSISGKNGAPITVYIPDW